MEFGTETQQIPWHAYNCIQPRHLELEHTVTLIENILIEKNYYKCLQKLWAVCVGSSTSSCVNKMAPLLRVKRYHLVHTGGDLSFERVPAGMYVHHLQKQPK